MPVTTSFVISNADNSFEATAYISTYEPYGRDVNLEHPNNLISTDGIFLNESGFFKLCPLFEVLLIDEFLRTNNIDPADDNLYNTAWWTRGKGKNNPCTPVDRECAGDQCNYRVQFKEIDTNGQRLSISRRDINDNHSRCCVLLLGIHVSGGAPMPGPASAHMPTPGPGSAHATFRPSQYHSNTARGAARGSGQRHFSESAGLDYLV